MKSTIDKEFQSEASREAEFRQQLEDLINRYNKEIGSDTPDLILAEYLCDCLAAFDKALTSRTKWYDG